MRRCLLLSSLLLACMLSLAQDYLLPLEERCQYSVAIAARGAEITGVCVVKTDAQGSRGAIVNEFGFHALDFTLSPDRRKVRLLNVMPALDRWYIKKVVRKDLGILFSARHAGAQRARRVIAIEPDGGVTLHNERFNLKYHLKKIDNNETAE